jgi:hypothetical protein
MEGAMQQYKIDKRDKQWAVTVNALQSAPQMKPPSPL